jgi:hypothetical protein
MEVWVVMVWRSLIGELQQSRKARAASECARALRYSNRAGEGGYGVVVDTADESGEKSPPESSACTA